MRGPPRVIDPELMNEGYVSMGVFIPGRITWKDKLWNSLALAPIVGLLAVVVWKLVIPGIFGR